MGARTGAFLSTFSHCSSVSQSTSPPTGGDDDSTMHLIYFPPTVPRPILFLIHPTASEAQNHTRYWYYASYCTPLSRQSVRIINYMIRAQAEWLILILLGRRRQDFSLWPRLFSMHWTKSNSHGQAICWVSSPTNSERAQTCHTGKKMFKQWKEIRNCVHTNRAVDRICNLHTKWTPDGVEYMSWRSHRWQRW